MVDRVAGYAPLCLGALALLFGCNGSSSVRSPDAAEKTPTVTTPASQPDDRVQERHEMVRLQLERRGISDPRVLAAMRRVPRHHFVPDDLGTHAYDDRPLPIGHGVTISQPYIVAFMTGLARVEPGARVLDVGTGSGYQAAVLADLGARVYAIEIIEPLAERAAERLNALGYDRVTVRSGDGWHGWPEEAPFDAIIVAAAPREIPEALKEQLAVGGRLILPVGVTQRQELTLITRTDEGYDERSVLPVSFVPMTGDADPR